MNIVESSKLNMYADDLIAWQELSGRIGDTNDEITRSIKVGEEGRCCNFAPLARHYRITA